MPCGENLVWVNFLFWPGALLTCYLVAKHNDFGLRQTFLAAVGARNYQRSPLINLALAATLLGSVGLAAWIIQTCPSG